jgi:hypothetical protein
MTEPPLYQVGLGPDRGTLMLLGTTRPSRPRLILPEMPFFAAGSSEGADPRWSAMGAREGVDLEGLLLFLRSRRLAYLTDSSSVVS